MRPPVLTFFNNTGGVGKTSLVYHLAWMYAKLGKRVVVADFDPQANLTAAFLDENTIENLWTDGQAGSTIYQSIKPLTGVGDIAEPQLEKIDTNLFLIPGDVELSNYEDILSTEWPQSMNDRNLYRPLRILSAFWQVIQMAENKLAGTEMAVDIVLIDIGPNLGAINRSALLATDYVVIPLGAD
ncbi:MAG: ParA family protein, partial [Salinispira sp.]